MTPDEINRAIAEHVGTADRWLIVKRGYFYRPDANGYTSSESQAWKLPLAEAKKHEYLHGDDPVTICRAAIPNYAGDLNAMHEAEKAAFGSSTQWVDFAYHLLTVLQSADMSVPDGMTCLLQATAAQRAEAFLRTIGKWRAE